MKFCFILVLLIVATNSINAEDLKERGASPDLKLYVFNCGALKMGDVSGFGLSNAETEVREMVVPCYIIEHDGERLLWDGGLPSNIAQKKGWQGEASGMMMRLDQTFNEQIEALGLTMASFKYTAFSHFHFDHVGIANEIMATTLIIQKPEYDAAFIEGSVFAAFNPAMYNSLNSAKKIIINGDYDVFGDGSVRILSAPGHTPGHQALFIDLPNYGPLVLSGDLYHFRFSRTNKRVPSFNFNASDTLASMEKIEKFVETNGAKFWIEHDMALFKQLKLAPLYYD